MIIGKLVRMVFWFFVVRFILKIFKNHNQKSKAQPYPSIDAEYTILKD